MRQGTIWLSVAALLLPSALWSTSSMAAPEKTPATADHQSPHSSLSQSKTFSTISQQNSLTGLDGATLEALLSASMAAQRGHLSLAAQIYLEQSQRLEAPLLAERALQIARLGNEPQLVLAAANQWAALDDQNATPRRILAAGAAEQGDWTMAMAMLLEIDASGQDADMESFIEEAITSGASAQELQGPIDAWLTRHPDSPHPLISRALLLSLQHHIDAAERDLERAESINGNLPDLWLARSQIALDREDAGHALEHARHGHALAPDDHRFILAMAQAHLAMDDVDAAEQQFNMLMKEMPKNIQLRLALGQLYLRSDHPEAAWRLLEPALKDGANEQNAAEYLGELYMLTGLVSERLDNIDRALSLYAQVPEGERFVPARVRGLQLFIERQRIDDALAWLEQQKGKYPEQSTTLTELALSMLDQNDQRDRADQLLDEEIDTQASDNEALLYRRAIRALERDDLEAMERDMQTLLARNPDNVEALNAWGYTLTQRTDRYEEALELLERAHRLAPDSAPVIDSLGWAHFHMGQLDQAIDLLRQAYMAMPDEEVAAHLAEALWATGDSEQARRIIAGASSRFQVHPSIDELLTRYPLLAPLIPVPTSTHTPSDSPQPSRETTP